MSSRLLIVAYPKISEKDYAWIQNIRERNDRLSFDAIKPHFTLFFPSNQFTQKDLVHATKRNVRGIGPFRFVLRCAVLMPPVVEDYSYMFLVPDEGFSYFVKLHNRIYRGPIAQTLRLDIPFVPHITVGSTKNLAHAKKVIDELERQSFEICGAIDSLAIVIEDGDRIRTIKEIVLD